MASKSGTSSGSRKHHADAKDQRGTKARTAKANSGSGSSSNKQPLISDRLKSLISSPVVRNAVAAGLASAAAALLYKKSDEAADGDQGAQPPKRLPDHGSSDRPANSARRKAKAAAAQVSKVAEAIADTAAGAKVVEKAKVSAKPRRVAAARDSGASEPAPQGIGAAEPKAEQRQRKIRSDAGIRRKPKKVEAQDKALGAVDLPALADTETSALALSSATVAAGDALLGSLEEQATESPSVDVQPPDDRPSPS